MKTVKGACIVKLFFLRIKKNVEIHTFLTKQLVTEET